MTLQQSFSNKQKRLFHSSRDLKRRVPPLVSAEEENCRSLDLRFLGVSWVIMGLVGLRFRVNQQVVVLWMASRVSMPDPAMDPC